MERDPHAVIEGVAIAAWAVRAEEAIVVVRASAVTAAERLRAAIAAAEERGYIGDAPAVTGRPLRVTVRELTGSFVVGEETVLLRALEDRRAQPDQRPPYPTEQGLWGRPTLVSNVKTLAAVPWIVANGAGAFASLGDPEAPGTTLAPARRHRPQAGHRRGAAERDDPGGARRSGRRSSAAGSRPCWSAGRPAASCRSSRWTRR